jgi:DNA (cytosine-5)-methyltransferase 1
MEHPFVWPGLSEPRVAWDAIGDLEPELDLPELKGKWATLLPTVPEGQNYLWHTDRGGGEQLFGYRTRYWSFLLKLAKDQPSWTLPAHPGPSTGPFHWDNRPLSVRELLRLQSFPADWMVEGTRVEQVRQVGNATPPLLAEAIGRSVAAHIAGVATPADDRTLEIPMCRPIPPAHRVKPLPASYRTLIGYHADHPGHGLGPGATQNKSQVESPSRQSDERSTQYTT